METRLLAQREGLMCCHQMETRLLAQREDHQMKSWLQGQTGRALELAQWWAPLEAQQHSQKMLEPLTKAQQHLQAQSQA